MSNRKYYKWYWTIPYNSEAVTFKLRQLRTKHSLLKYYHKTGLFVR